MKTAAIILRNALTLLVLFFLMLFLPCTNQAQTTTPQQFEDSNSIVITSIFDNENPDDGLVTLREAMNLAHSGGTTENGEVVDKNAKVNIDLSKIGGTIVLTSRLPAVDKDIAIYGYPSQNLTIDGDNKYRIFFVRKGSLWLENLILQKGRAQGGHGNNNDYPGAGGGGMGGALFVNKYAKAYCNNIQFLNNSARGGNAGKENDNYLDGSGGGFYGNGSGKYGGSGGYLGNEGKGGDFVISMYSKTARHGGFGGGGGTYWKYPGAHYGGDGGFGGGGGSGSPDSEHSQATYTGDPGAFGGKAYSSSYSARAGGGAGLGGAVFVREHGVFTASDCAFNGNSTYGGSGTSSSGNGQGKAGAIFIHNTNARAFLEDCTFNNNSASYSNGSYAPIFTHQDNNDIYGANSPIIPHINYVKLEHYPPLNDTDISFLAQFDADVVGVDATDFGFDTDDPGDTQVASVEEIDPQNYRIIVKHTRNQGFVTLKIIDDDTIHDTVRNYPIGFIGEGNGDYTGETCYFHPTVQVSSILPLSGDLKEYGLQIQNGIKLAIDQHQITNTSIHQAVLSWNSYDNLSATATAEGLVVDASNNENVLALFGGAASNNTLRMAELCGDNHIPLFSPSSTSNLLSEKDFTVKVVPSDRYQVEAIYQAMYKYLLKYKGGKILIIAEDSEYGHGFLELLDKEEIFFDWDDDKNDYAYIFPSHEIDTEKAIQFIYDKYSTEFISAVVLAVYEDDALELVKALERHESNLLTALTYFFTDSATTEKALDYNYLPPYLSFFGVTPIIPDSSDARYFASKYNSAYGSQPEWFSYYAYDAVTAFNKAINDSTEITRQGIWNTIPWLRFDGLTGTKTFDEKGNLYSAAYDLHFISSSSREWNKIETILVQQPQVTSSISGALKIQSRSVPSGDQTMNAPLTFTYSLNAADPLISHLAGEKYEETGWIAEPLDADIGGVLMAYYEDVERGLSTDNQPFVFEDGETYYLTFNVIRESITTEPTEGDILDITVKSVYRYQNGNDVTNFAHQDLLNHKTSFADWPDEGSTQITIPIAYQSAAPDGLTINNEDNRFHWELKLLNAAKQKVLLTSVEIGTNAPTGIEDFMLY